MSDSVHTHASDEDLLAACIERFPALDEAALVALCGGNRARAARLRERLATLERMGLLGDGARESVPLLLGRYRVQELLGRGGMGSVYLGIDERDGARVALKVGQSPLSTAIAGAQLDRARLRFEREVHAAMQLSHPGIVAILGAGESEGRPYYAMEYVEGTTLARVIEELRERRVPFDQLSGALLGEIVDANSPRPARAASPAVAVDRFERSYVENVCRIVIEVAQALDYAHERSIVHRDVKPANVLLGRDGRVKLFDLGLARIADQPALTRSGELTGSPFYMSPEQLSGSPESLDRRTDVYSLGVTLFELLTLRRPFEGPSSAQVFRQIQSREAPLPRRINPWIPRDLETICLNAMEKDPRRRYPSAREFALDLERFLDFRPVRAKPVGAGRRVARFVRRNPALASASSLALLVAIGLPIGLLWANSAIRDQERRATREAGLKARVTDFLVQQFELTDEQRQQGATISARELLDRGAARLSQDFADDPAVRAELLAAVGTVYANLGLHERAIPLLDRALALRQSGDPTRPAALAELLEQLASSHLRSGEPRSALRLCERGLAALTEDPQASGASEVRIRRTAAAAQLQLGDRAGAERSLQLALEKLRADPAAQEELRVRVLDDAAALALADGRAALATAHWNEALSILRSAWSPDLQALARIHAQLASADEARGDLDSAREHRAHASRLSEVLPDPQLPPPFETDDPMQREYERQFQIGITALQERATQRAVAAFERCLELDPRRGVCAYNIACAHALAGDVERGLAGLERAAQLGFGVAEYRRRVAESDPEIADLRATKRGRAALERMHAQAASIEEFAQRDWVHEPPALTADRPAPLLVVLHAQGRTPQDVLDGPWREVAEALGFVLFAPAGRIPTGLEPQEGLAWIEAGGDLLRRPLQAEHELGVSLRDLFERRAIDRERVWIAGEDQGATLAFELALRAPGLYRGALLLDGPIRADGASEDLRKAAALGLRVAFIAGPRCATASQTPAQLATRMEAWLGGVGFRERRTVAIESDAQIVDALHRGLFE